MQTKSTIVACTAITAMLFLFVASTGHLSPINDHVFVNTLFEGRAFGGYVDRTIGRFTPLASMEYALASRLLWPSATLFYLIHATKIAITAGLLLYALSLAGARGWLAFGLWFASIVTIGFGYSAMVLQAGEINELLLCVLFACIVLRRERGELQGAWPLAVAVAAMVANMLYKETAFAVAITFGVAEMVRARFAGRTMPRYAIALTATGIAYLAFYAVWHGTSLKGSYASTHSTPVGALLSSYAANDTLIVFVAAPALLIRIALIATRKVPPTIFDSLLIGAITYDLTFGALRMYSAYYWLPSYGFAAVGLAGIASGHVARLVVSAAAIALTANNVPVVASDLYSARTISGNYAQFIDGLANWIWSNPTADGAPRDVVLVGVDMPSQVEISTSIDRFLSGRGLPHSAYRLESDRTPKVGDVLVYNPYQATLAWPPIGTPLSETILSTSDNHTAPRWSIWQWANICLGDAAGCKPQIYGNSPFTGYAAFIETRRAETAAVAQPLQRPSYEVGPVALPDRIRAGSEMWVDVSVRNAGTQPWPVAQIDKAGPYVHMSYAWLDAQGHSVFDGDRVNFPATMMPGDTASVRMLIHAPVLRGNYTLVLTPVQEGVSWFYQGDPNAAGAKKKIDIFQSIFSRVAHRVRHVF
jgi:hypothetical protein